MRTLSYHHSERDLAHLAVEPLVLAMRGYTPNPPKPAK